MSQRSSYALSREQDQPMARKQIRMNIGSGIVKLNVTTDSRNAVKAEAVKRMILSGLAKT